MEETFHLVVISSYVMMNFRAVCEPIELIRGFCLICNRAAHKTQPMGLKVLQNSSEADSLLVFALKKKHSVVNVQEIVLS